MTMYSKELEVYIEELEIKNLQLKKENEELYKILVHIAPEQLTTQINLGNKKLFKKLYKLGKEPL
jgi:hypothetical protein